MAISNAICNSFKLELINAEHDFNTHTFKIALYSSSASLGSSTTAYTTTNEVSGENYSAGGATLSGGSIARTDNIAYVDFNDASWNAATFTARGALIYNASNSNKAIMVIDFGYDQVLNGAGFTIVWPAAQSTTALLRIS